MPKDTAFFAAPDLDEVGLFEGSPSDAYEYSSAAPTEPYTNQHENPSEFFHPADLEGSWPHVSEPRDTVHTQAEVGRKPPHKFTNEMREKMSGMLLLKSATAPIQTAEIINPQKNAIIRFSAPSKQIHTDIEVPLDISANDLIIGLNSAYSLGIDVSDICQCYLSCENPITLLKGKHLLCEYGLRNGSLVTYYR